MQQCHLSSTPSYRSSTVNVYVLQSTTSPLNVSIAKHSNTEEQRYDTYFETFCSRTVSKIIRLKLPRIPDLHSYNTS